MFFIEKMSHSILKNTQKIASQRIEPFSFCIMKNKDLQRVVFSKYQDGDRPTKTYRDLNRAIGLSAIERWCKSIREHGSVKLTSPPDRPRTIRTKGAIKKIKQ
jgi:hypothetical protein